MSNFIGSSGFIDGLSPFQRAIAQLIAREQGIISSASSGETFSQIAGKAPDRVQELFFLQNNPITKLANAQLKRQDSTISKALQRRLGQTNQSSGQFGGGKGLTTESFKNIKQLQGRETTGRLSRKAAEDLVKKLKGTSKGAVAGTSGVVSFGAGVPTIPTDFASQNFPVSAQNAQVQFDQIKRELKRRLGIE